MPLIVALALLLGGCDVLFHIDDGAAGAPGDGGAGDAVADAAVIGDGGGGGTIRLVEERDASGPSATSLPFSFDGDVPPGALVVIVIGWESDPQSITITDSAGNTYQPAVPAATMGSVGEAIYYAENVAGGAADVTVTFGAAAQNAKVAGLAYDGIVSGDSLAAMVTTFGSGLVIASDAVSPVPAHVLLVAGVFGDGIVAAGAGYAPRTMWTTAALAEDREVSSAGPFVALAQLSKDSSWVIQLAAFAAR